MPVGPKKDQAFHIACLTTSQRIYSASRLRRLFLIKVADDLMWHVAAPDIRLLSEAFIAATERKPCSSTSSKFSDLSPVSWGKTESQKSESPPIDQTVPSTSDTQPGSSPRAVSNMLSQLRDGELLPRNTIQQSTMETFSVYQNQTAKRKQEESDSFDDTSTDERPKKHSKSDRDDGDGDGDEDDEDSSIPTAWMSPSSDARSNRPEFMYLPHSVHQKIIDKLALLDVIHLGLTSRYFLRLLAKHLQSMTTTTLGQWAGQSIICLGDETADNDFPPTVYQEPTLQVTFGPELDKSADMDHPTLLEYVRGCDSAPAPFIPTLADCGFLSSKGFDEEFYNLPVTLIGEMIDRLCPAMSDFYPENVDWVLRNLTTNEYVLTEAISLRKQDRHGPQNDYVGFGDAILIRACWSTKPPLGLKIAKGMPIHRGVWAGHRLEIIPLSDHRREMIAQTQENRLRHERGESVEKCWKDVTSEVRDEVGSLWSRECGRHWKTILFRRTIK
ncbi:uncharacterized protein GIQ15_05279 [Arthroderma uncinatum]|uniref:uncharacterized protein n=1 Tax=Arthroderma uncinatum TaxID=74035 RepID=UPI00144AD128|nr:uncharacterized protein GIQ15_05279 [Arthroderma uncinatum]KAF3482520.1 hypothetical protein GIQ15_05279 [Arthroderma uncinatum]